MGMLKQVQHDEHYFLAKTCIWVRDAATMLKLFFAFRNLVYG
jgi:hypothetical protein